MRENSCLACLWVKAATHESHRSLTLGLSLLITLVPNFETLGTFPNCIASGIKIKSSFIFCPQIQRCPHPLTLTLSVCNPSSNGKESYKMMRFWDMP